MTAAIVQEVVAVVPVDAVSASHPDVRVIPLSMIRENPEVQSLRKVDRQSEGYLNLVDSIRKLGVLNAISVRELHDPQFGTVVFGLVDGLHRFSASRDAGLTEIPCIVTKKSDIELLQAQIHANLQRIETRPVEYSEQLRKILQLDPYLTVNALAEQLSKSPTWVEDRLSLNGLPDSFKDLIREGRLGLANAYVLAKLNKEAPDELPTFLERALTESPNQFVPSLAGHIKELKDAKRKGKPAEPKVFQPTAHMKSMGEIKEELQSGDAGRQLITQLKLTNPQDAWAMAVKWCVNLDPAGVQAQTDKEEKRKKDSKELAEKRKKEREEKAALEAHSIAAALR